MGYARRRRFHLAGASVCETERQGITVADSYKEIVVHNGKVKKGVKNVKLLISIFVLRVLKLCSFFWRGF